ncbi:MAG: hypothetical protein K8L91_33200 [Anaerolineae bacterium]|nr:hypothetical protein [Anaerolineae bacterium]
MNGKAQMSNGSEILGRPTLSPDLLKRLAKIYEIAILRYNQSKSIEMANDATADNSNAVLTHKTGKSGDGADG